MLKIVDSGEVYICDFGEGQGSIQGGVRPCVIIDNKNACVYSPCIHCAPLTSQNKKNIPLHYEITKEGCDCLEQDSTILCEQYTLVDKSQLKEKIGKITQLDLIKVIELCKKNFPYYYG